MVFETERVWNSKHRAKSMVERKLWHICRYGREFWIREIEELSSALNGNVVPDGSLPHDGSLRYSLNSRTSEISQPMAPQPFKTSFASLAFRPKPGFARERKHWDGRGGSRDMSLRRWENERRNRKGKDVVAREANTRRHLWEQMSVMNCVLLQASKFDVSRNVKASVLLS